MKNEDLFWYWINERHRIYLRKESGEKPPWTDDEILRTYYFTNVFRELDAVTVWIRENWREPYAEHPNLWFAMCVARCINEPSTLEALGFPEYWDAESAREIMLGLQADGKRLYSPAYVISNCGNTCDKPMFTCTYVLKPIWDAQPVPEDSDNLQSYHKRLIQFMGMGGFMAYEVVSDLRWTRYFDTADDILTWANPGPGCKRGINRLYGWPPKTPISDTQALSVMRSLLEKSGDCIESYVPQLEMREVEHSLCEFDKYMRAYLGEGTPKRRYKGKG